MQLISIALIVVGFPVGDLSHKLFIHVRHLDVIFSLLFIINYKLLLIDYIVFSAKRVSGWKDGIQPLSLIKAITKKNQP